MAGAGGAASPRRVAYRHDWGQPLDVSARDGSGVLVTLSSGSPRRLAGYHGSVARRRSPARLVIALSVAAVPRSSCSTPRSRAAARLRSLPANWAAARTSSRSAASPSGRSAATPTPAACASGCATSARRRAPAARRGLPRLRAGPFKPGRGSSWRGSSARGGTFVATPGTMITKCPSKYAPKKSQTSAS